MRTTALFVIVLAACGGKDDGSVTVGDYAFALPAGWVKGNKDPVLEGISLRLDATDPHDVMTATLTAGTGGNTNDDNACRATADAMARQAPRVTIRSVNAVALPVGKACRFTVFGVVPVHGTDPVVSEELMIGGAHGLWVRCSHADGGGRVGDCEALFASLRRR